MLAFVYDLCNITACGSVKVGYYLVKEMASYSIIIPFATKVSWTLINSPLLCFSEDSFFGK